jgi:hypothetical protein
MEPHGRAMLDPNGPGVGIKIHGSGSREETSHISFGIPRSGRSTPRRLFTQQSESMSPVFTTQAERSRAILRVVSTG